MKKHTIKTTAAFLLMLIATTLGSCVKGDKGDTGPAGANGTNGINGNANVKSGVATVYPSNWGWDATGLYNYVEITDNDITSAIASSGTVSVFITTSSSQNTWIALPYTVWGNPCYNYNYVFYANHVELFSSNTNLVSSPPTGTMYVKAVAISASQRKAHPNTNWKDYNQVMAVANESASKTN